MDGFQPSGQGFEKIAQAIKLVDLVKSMDGTLKLEDADFKVLSEAVEKMTWTPMAARTFLPFYQAVKDAQEVKTPTEKTG